jgi:transposase
MKNLVGFGTRAAGEYLREVSLEEEQPWLTLSDALWERIEPLLPPQKPRRFRFPGRKPLDRRKILTRIIFVLKTGIPWEELPQEMGCGCGMTCLNYLKAWQRAGVWPRLHHILLAELREADRMDWSRAAVDSTHARALGGGENLLPTGSARLGSGVGALRSFLDAIQIEIHGIGTGPHFSDQGGFLVVFLGYDGYLGVDYIAKLVHSLLGDSACALNRDSILPDEETLRDRVLPPLNHGTRIRARCALIGIAIDRAR